MTNTETATRTTILGRRLVPVLLIEDNPADIRLTLEASSTCGLTRLEVITDGDTALAYLRHQPPYQDAPRPGLVLLDLNLPGIDGRHVLTAIKTDPDLHTIPVIILTTSNTPTVTSSNPWASPRWPTPSRPSARSGSTPPPCHPPGKTHNDRTGNPDQPHTRHCRRAARTGDGAAVADSADRGQPVRRPAHPGTAPRVRYHLRGRGRPRRGHRAAA